MDGATANTLFLCGKVQKWVEKAAPLEDEYHAICKSFADSKHPRLDSSVPCSLLSPLALNFLVEMDDSRNGPISMGVGHFGSRIGLTPFSLNDLLQYAEEGHCEEWHKRSGRVTVQTASWVFNGEYPMVIATVNIELSTLPLLRA